MNVKLSGTFNTDIANKIFLTIEKSIIPNIVVEISPAEIKFFEETVTMRDARLVV